MKFTHFKKSGEHKLVDFIKKNTKDDDKWTEHMDNAKEDISKIIHEIQQFYKELIPELSTSYRNGDINSVPK